MKAQPLPKPGERYLLQCFLLLCGMFAISACHRSTPIPYTAQEIVTRSAARMKSLTGFHFVIDRSGAPAFLDEEGTLSFRRAEGDFVAPDRAQATVRVIAPGMVVEIQICGIGSRYWETQLLSGEWQELPEATGFNPAVLFDAQIGFQPILEADLLDLQLVGMEELEDAPGRQLYAITGRLRGERIYEMSYGLIGPETAAVRLWIVPETFDLYRSSFVEPAPEGEEATTWQVDFWDWGKVADIQPPLANK